MLCIVVFFGDALDDRVGLWTWPFLLCVLAGTGFVRRQVFAFQGLSNAVDIPRSAPALPGHPDALSGGHVGKLTLAERIPLGLVYLPLLLRWLGFAVKHRSLTLPAIANPGDRRRDGMWDEPRSGYLRAATAASPQWVADFVLL